MPDTSITDRPPNEARWLALCADVGEDDRTLNTAMGGALNTIQRRRPGRTWVTMDAETWEDLYTVALANYRELAAL